MKVERDGSTIEAEGNTITIVLDRERDIDSTKLNNYLQFILIDLGIDQRHLMGKPEAPVPVQLEEPEPAPPLPPSS